MIKPKVRCEKKFIINEVDYRIISPLLKASLQKDKFSNQSGEYYVRSLYFDTLDDKDYKEKQAALEKRQKIRLRIYNTNQDTVKLENKRKYGRYMIKSVVEITADDANHMQNGEYDCLLKYENEIADSIYAELISGCRVPKIIVDYYREAYVEESMGFRINFDKRITTTTDCHLFDGNLITTPIQHDSYYVLEAKYSEYIPAHVQSLLSSYNLIETTYSKYVYSRFDI